MVGSTFPFSSKNLPMPSLFLIDHSVYTIISWISAGKAAIDSIMYPHAAHCTLSSVSTSMWIFSSAMIISPLLTVTGNPGTWHSIVQTKPSRHMLDPCVPPEHHMACLSQVRRCTRWYHRQPGLQSHLPWGKAGRERAPESVSDCRRIPCYA